MNFVAIFSASVAMIFAIAFYLVSTNAEIVADGFRVQVFVVIASILMILESARSMVQIVVSSERTLLSSFIVLISKVGVVLPVSFAAVYQTFERTSVCINGATGKHDALHFSYTTLTTLGYGDLAPLGYCRVFTALESLVGYFSLGILVSLGVVLLQSENKKAREQRDEELLQQLRSEREKLIDEIAELKNKETNETS